MPDQKNKNGETPQKGSDAKKQNKPAHGEKYIRVTRNGPYLVYGNPPLRQEFILPNEQGNSWDYGKGQEFPNPSPAALCRCGGSHKAPFCDGSHVTHAFDGTETAPREPILEGARAYRGPNLTLWDNEVYCAYARFCDAFGQVWNLVQVGEGESDALAVREMAHCPSGRLMMTPKEGDQAMEPQLEPAIGVLEDPELGCSGPLFVKGGLRVESSDGFSYEIRNRQTLCRCGQSANKPFCNGAHAEVKYRDGIQGDDFEKNRDYE